MAQKRGNIVLPPPTPSPPPSPETDKTKLDKLLTAKKSEKDTTDNAITNLGERPPSSRLTHLQNTLGFFEREIQVLECTRQLHDIAEDLKIERKIDQDKEKMLWAAIGKESLRFHQENEKGWDVEVWKLVDPILGRLLGALGKEEPLPESERSYATGIDH